jgi:hypothetical protein
MTWGNAPTFGDFFGGWVPGFGLANIVIPPGLFRWHKANGLLYTDAAGTDLVDTNLDPIGFQSDESGLGHHITQATAAAKPTWLSGGPAVLNAIGDTLEGTDTCLAGSDFTICFTGELSSYDKVILAEWDTTDINQYFNLGTTVSGQIRLFIDDGAGLAVPTFPDIVPPLNTPVTLFLTFDNTTKNYNLYRYTGGVLVPSTSNPISSKAPLTTNTFAKGVRYITGSRDKYFTGKYFEDSITTLVKTTVEMETQGAALAATWGVS